MKRLNIRKILLERGFKGNLFDDAATRALYATDASAYRDVPDMVCYPESEYDIEILIHIANENKLPIIPRAGGTSLAGQVVGKGLVVDVSRHLHNIIEVDPQHAWVRVQPGVVLDELNQYLHPYNLFFAPETSTSNRCTLGGMVGNNACGAHSLIYGSTRDHLLEVTGFLSDGSKVVFKDLNINQLEAYTKGDSLENSIYLGIFNLLHNKENQFEIINSYPDPQIRRRNTGYALDMLLHSSPFTDAEKPFNMCRLIAGSEGTLLFITEIKLSLLPLPPKEKGIVCAHFKTLEEALEANLIALKYNPGAIELIDDIIISCTKENIEQRKNRFFIQGEPGAILLIEFARETKNEVENIKQLLEQEMLNSKLGYAFPIVYGADMSKVWALRKAALGLLSNISGDAKPVSLVEDTAVSPQKLPQYIADFKTILKKYELTCVFHAHIATGELHLRPVLNLKDPEGLKIFRAVATETALLVKKYNGSLSGEHGDGRLRGEFIPIIIGAHNFELCKTVKNLFDPNHIFNPGKITDSPPMDSYLRYASTAKNGERKTVFNYNESLGFVRHIERCNGSADCRKSAAIGGTMCPSFQATRNEKDSTRARANILREFFTNHTEHSHLQLDDVKEVLDLCLSCKACKAECPSNVDMAKLKAEFLQFYYDKKGIPIRTWMVAHMHTFYKMAATVPGLYNGILKNKTLSRVIKSILGFSEHRNIPFSSGITVKRWAKLHLLTLNNALQQPQGEVCIFIDEFTNYLDVLAGIKSIVLLHNLGYKINISEVENSGRAYFSKGMLKRAKQIMFTNVNIVQHEVSAHKPLIGIEPSATFVFRDEYLALADENINKKVDFIAQNTFLIEEFVSNEFQTGRLKTDIFTKSAATILLHGHCYQKALTGTASVLHFLSIPANYTVKELKTGCCGMAGAFGYEKEHYNTSMKIGELRLFPAVRAASDEVLVAASGTSCRQQIADGTGRKALHPVEILYNALETPSFSSLIPHTI